MEKSALRKIYLEKRKNLSREEWERRNRQVKEQLLGYFDFGKIKMVHCFLPILTHNEIDTWPIIKALQEKSINVVVSKTKWKSVSMEHFLLTPDTVLQNNRWGIPEPVAGELIPASQLDMVLVPLLAFDRAGHRVGYGKGFYDRFLSQCLPNTLKIGLSLEQPIPKIADTNAYDVVLDFGVTPEKVWGFQ